MNLFGLSLVILIVTTATIGQAVTCPMVLPPPLGHKGRSAACVMYQHFSVAACDLLPVRRSNTKEKTRRIAVLRAFEILTFPTSCHGRGCLPVILDRITYLWQTINWIFREESILR